MAKKEEKKKKENKYERFSKVEKDEDKVKEAPKLKGKCLRCKKPMHKNHDSCKSCQKKDRLKSKANRRGKNKNHYALQGEGE